MLKQVFILLVLSLVISLAYSYHTVGRRSAYSGRNYYYGNSPLSNKNLVRYGYGYDYSPEYADVNYNYGGRYLY